MASPSVDAGDGTTIDFATSSFSAEVTNIDWGGIERESIDTTHLGTAEAGAGAIANKTYIPSDMTDPGEITMDIHFNPDTEPPINASDVAETITVTFASGATWACSGFITGYEPGVPLEDKMTASVTIKCTGNITISAAT